MKRWDVITVFDACVDLVVDLGDLQVEFDQKEKLVQSARVTMGGSCCIFASQCAKLGLRTTGVGLIGKDAFGAAVLSGLKSAGVSTDYICEDDTVSTAVGIALNRGEDRAILTDANSIQKTTGEALADELLKSARHLHIGSYYLLTGLRPAVPGLLERAKAFGLTTSLDTNWDPEEQWEMPVAVLKNVDYFLPNRAEIEFITGLQLPEAAESLKDFAGVVAVKEGGEGATLFVKDKQLKLPPPKTRVVDTIGAGDSFDAGFIWARLHGLDEQTTLKSALFCGSMNTRALGGCDGQATLQELGAFLKTETAI